MRKDNCLLTCCLGFGLLGLAPSARAADDLFALSIEGGPRTAYSGSCHLTGDSGEETLDLGGLPPLHRILGGRQLNCRIRQEGAEGFLVVEIRHGTSISQSRTQGAGSIVVVVLK